MFDDKEKVLICPTCKQPCELLDGPCGVSQRPQHFMLAEKIENTIFQHGTKSTCTYPRWRTVQFCLSYDPSRLRKNQIVKKSPELKIALTLREFHSQNFGSTNVLAAVLHFLQGSPQTAAQHSLDPHGKSIKCPMHPEQQLKLFCTTCHQVICGECSTLLHRDHRCTTVARAGRVYGRFVRSAIEQTRPLEDYALQQVAKLNDLTVRINSRCEAVQREVDAFVGEYVAALEEHRKALTGQIGDIRQAKTDMIMAQKLDLGLLEVLCLFVDHEKLEHGGITVQSELRFRNDEDHSVVVCIANNQDGSNALCFVPNRAGMMHLILSVDGKIIEERYNSLGS
ncbi:hypothetical protein ZHAS_00022013 [Anopheles sinensis]|uniref:B box-type domain-containing protein n=1 Tax=Anopheles sinensis TaxID=74873 RepID=A0A084WU85_ANOSI|nr:hypothetical protein ZHAS_00022013 [Anopheles sinensis]